MKFRTALTVALVLPATGVLTCPVAPTYAAAAVCQGQLATIEGSTGTITGTEGNDVIVSTGADTRVEGLGGNDLICVVGGDVVTGAGNDSVVSAAPSGVNTSPWLDHGSDTYTSGAGSSYVYVHDVASVHVTLGPGGGTVELHPTSMPGTGDIDFGSGPAFLYAFGTKEARVDLAARTVSVNQRLHLTFTDLHSATAAACKVRMAGDGGPNTLDAFGSDVAVTGGGGNDKLSRVGNGFDLSLPRCGTYRSVFRGQGGADRLTGRAGDDRLVGGPGRDVAQGAGGSDICRTEVRKNCER
jgi:Ca2+-binding RTX toxin-like protein